MHHTVPVGLFSVRWRRASDTRQYSENAQHNEENNLKEMPISTVRDLEQYQFPSPERIHSLGRH